MPHDCWLHRLHRRLARLECLLKGHRPDLGMRYWLPLEYACERCDQAVTRSQVEAIVDEIAFGVEGTSKPAPWLARNPPPGFDGTREHWSRLTDEQKREFR